MSKLSLTQASEIRAELVKYQEILRTSSPRALAERYGVSVHVINSLKAYRSYKKAR